MTIAKKPIKNAVSAEKFIHGTEQKSVRTIGKKAVITVSISPEILHKIDAWAEKNGVSRAAALAIAWEVFERSRG